MATYVPAKRATAYKFYVGLIDQSNTKLLKANPTIAAGDFKVSKDGGAFANLTTLPSANPASGRAVMIDLDATEMTADNLVVQCVDAAGAEWCDLLINIATAARQIDDLAYPATPGRSMVVDAAGLVDANMVKAGPTGSGTAQTAGDIIGDTNDIQARLPAALTADGNIKADTLRVGGTLQTAGDIPALVTAVDNFVDTEVAAIITLLGTPAGASVSADIAAVKVDSAAILVDTGTTLDGRIPAALTAGGFMKADILAVDGDANAPTRLKRGVLSTVLGTCAALGSTTSVIASSLTASAVNDQFIGRLIVFDTGTTTSALRGQATDITDYDHATLTFTVTALTTAPASGDTFTVV